MVEIINNPAYGGNVDRTGQGISESMQNIASAFAPRQADLAGQLAIQNYKDKMAAQGVIGDLAGRYSDASQDYAQDAPDYSTRQPAPTITMGDPSGVARAFMLLGADPGKAIQSMSALQGGINAPGVGLGATMDDKYASTPEGEAVAANRTASLEPYVYAGPNGVPQVTNKGVAASGALPGGGTPLISTDQQKAVELGRLIFGQPSAPPQGAAPPSAPDAAIAVPGYSGTFTRGQATDADGVPSQAEWDAASKPGAIAQPAQPVATADQRIALGLDKNGTTPYNVEWKDDAGVKHNMVTTDPTTDIANAKIAQFNPTVSNALGGGTNIFTGDTASKFGGTMQEEQAKDIYGKIKAGDSAQQVVELSNEAMGSLQSILKNGNTTGIGAKTMYNIKNAANVAGNSLFGKDFVPFGDLSDQGVFTKATNSISMAALKQLVQGAGGRITNMEVQQFQQMNPGWDLTPEGNMRMLSLINQAAVRDQTLSDGMRKMLGDAERKGGMPNPGDLESFRSDFLSAHHLVDPKTGQDYSVAAQQSLASGGQQGAVNMQGAIPQSAAAYLKANPNLAPQFEQKYGPGSSKAILGGQ